MTSQPEDSKYEHEGRVVEHADIVVGLPGESPSARTIEHTGDIVTKEYLGDSISDGYRLKSALFSKAFTEIGMGRYQWELFVVTEIG